MMVKVMICFLWTLKGCIFVVFATKDEAQKVLTADEVKYDGKDLLRENKY